MQGPAQEQHSPAARLPCNAADTREISWPGLLAAAPHLCSWASGSGLCQLGLQLPPLTLKLLPQLLQFKVILPGQLACSGVLQLLDALRLPVGVLPQLCNLRIQRSTPAAHSPDGWHWRKASEDWNKQAKDRKGSCLKSQTRVILHFLTHRQNNP